METKVKTNEGEKSISEIVVSLSYVSYATNRGYGMSHEALVRIGIGNDSFKQMYEGRSK